MSSENQNDKKEPLHKRISTSRRTFLGVLGALGASGSSLAQLEGDTEESLSAAGFQTNLTQQYERSKYVTSPSSAFDPAALSAGQIAWQTDTGEFGVKSESGMERPPLDVKSVHTDELATSAIAPLKLGILPDLHWNASTKPTKKAALDEFINQMNNEGRDLCIHVGDFVSEGSYSGTLSGITEARDYIENTGGSDGTGLDMPIHYQIGNHEYKHLNDGSMADIYEAFGWGRSLADTCFTIEKKGWKIISLNSSYATTETTNATDDSRVPDSSDPFDAISWLDAEMDTDKPVILYTHYPLDNGPGGNYFLTGNAYKTLQTIAKHDNLVVNIFGHVHGHDDYDVGRQNVGPFGMPYYCAGHISGGEQVYTYGNPPHEHLFAWGDFYHPRRYSLNNNLNTFDRHNHATDSLSGGGFWHPRTHMRGGGEDRLSDLSALTPLGTDKTGSGNFSQTGYRRELRLLTGTTASSGTRTQFERLNTPLPRWEVLESFSVKATMSAVGGSNSYLARIYRGDSPYQSATGNPGYGFKIENGTLYGEAVDASGNIGTSSSLISVSQGEELFLSAMLFAPHIARFYAKKGNGGNWQAADLTTNLPTGGSGNRWLFSANVENPSVAENYQLDLNDHKFWKRGN